MFRQNRFLTVLYSHLAPQQWLLGVSMAIVFWLINVMTRHSCPLILQWAQHGPHSMLMAGLCVVWLLKAAWVSPNTSIGYSYPCHCCLGKSQACTKHDTDSESAVATTLCPSKSAHDLISACRAIGNLSFTTAMYGPLNTISLLYLSLPQFCPSSLPHQLLPGKVLLCVRALVFISISWFGSSDLTLATWQLFLGFGLHSTVISSSSLSPYHRLSVVSPPRWESLHSSAVSPIWVSPSSYTAFTAIFHLRTSASLLARHRIPTPAFFLSPLAPLPKWVTSNSKCPEPEHISVPFLLPIFPTHLFSLVDTQWGRQKHLWPSLLFFLICVAFMSYHFVLMPWGLPASLVLVFHMLVSHYSSCIQDAFFSWPARIYPSPHASLSRWP